MWYVVVVAVARVECSVVSLAGVVEMEAVVECDLVSIVGITDVIIIVLVW